MSNERTGYGAKVAIIGAFASIISAIVAIASYCTYSSPLIVYGSFFLFIATVVIIVWLFPVRLLINFYKNRRETSKNNKIAKRFFEEFEEGNFMGDFKLFIAGSLGLHKPYAFHFVIENLLNLEDFRGKIPEPPTNLVSLYFNHWTGTFNRSDRTKKDFDLVFRDFENILHEYYSLFIEKPIRAIRNVGNEVPEHIKIEWKKAVNDYNEFARDWNKFCNRVRRGFGVSEGFDIGALQGIRLAEEL